MDLKLKDRICLVTGASVGIGKGIVKALAKEGAITIAVARRTNLLQELSDEVNKMGAERTHLITEDLSTQEGPEKVALKVLKKFGRIDVLINNAGQSVAANWDSPDELWVDSFNLNFHAARRLTTPLIPEMRKNNWGRIINITGGMEVAGLNAASTGKAATHMWSKGLSRELGPEGITVNCVAPGRINSEQILGRLHPDLEKRNEFIKREIPAGYFGEPEDLAVLVTFLSSPIARYISGEVIRVDGGMAKFAH